MNVLSTFNKYGRRKHNLKIYMKKNGWNKTLIGSNITHNELMMDRLKEYNNMNETFTNLEIDKNVSFRKKMVISEQSLLIIQNKLSLY